MKKLTPIRLSIFVTALAILMIVLALPGDSALAFEAGELGNVRFTVINYSHQPFTLRAYGPETYTFEVAPYSKRAWFVTRGTYSFVMEACNHTKSGTLNLNIFQTMHVPVCGGNAGKIGDKNHHIDVADYIKMVRIKIRNKTQYHIRLYLRTIENHYYLNLKPREVTTLVVPRDRYVYSFLACDNLQVGYYEARKYIPLDLKCKVD
jgi:hypothetical protein